VIGGGGNDRLTGALATGTSGASLGEGQIDLLIGGLGADTFVLGDSRGVFYDDRIATNSGRSDYAIIQDFTKGVDKIQLLTGNYFTTVTGGNTSIYWDANANGRFETQLSSSDELIAIINNSTISSSDIIWA
jgi:Ca2+-binding RTX toxin-like protein